VRCNARSGHAVLWGWCLFDRTQCVGSRPGQPGELLYRELLLMLLAVYFACAAASVDNDLGRNHSPYGSVHCLC
jgi:hypothetical protein